MNETHYTLRYKTFEGVRVELCVAAESVTAAIAIAREEVPSLLQHPNLIDSVIRGYS